MIDYPTGDHLFKMCFRRQGSVVPKALSIAAPSTLLAVLLVVFSEQLEDVREELGLSSKNSTVMWAALTAPLFTMIAFRTSQAWGRFWEGTSLLHAMRGEWFDSASCLSTFTANAKATKPEAVSEFRHTLLRLMSLCHGSALDELKEEETESYEVLDIKGLDRQTVTILMECKTKKFNRVEVLLHMIQVLVSNAQAEGVISVPPPILSRVYQTLSRGFVNLLDAKKIKDTKFPFPYAQAIAVLLLTLAVLTPIVLSTMIPHVLLCGVSTFVPVFGLLCLNYAAEELEMPFGEDSNDLPLSHFQEEMNSSLLMLIHDWSDHLAKTNSSALRDWESLSGSLHDARNSIKNISYQPTVVGGKRQSVYTCKTTDFSDMDGADEINSEYEEGWPSLDGSHGASGDASNNDATATDGHGLTVTMPPAPPPAESKATPNLEDSPRNTAFDSPKGQHHGECVQALVSAAMTLQSLQGPATKNAEPEARENTGSSARSGRSAKTKERQLSHGSNNASLKAVGVTVTGNKTPPKSRPVLAGRGPGPLIGSVPASSPTYPAAPSYRDGEEAQDKGDLNGSRWGTSINEAPRARKGDVNPERERVAGSLGGQIISGFASNPTLPTREM